jgi:tRNA dimethylallyltransferase
LVGFVDPTGEFSAGRFAQLAHAEIDQLIAEGRRPIVVGGTGLYLRAALADLDLRPPVSPEIRAEVEQNVAEHGPEAVWADLDPDVAATIHPRDRKRIARTIELQRSGIDPPRSSEGLWTARLRRPTLLVGLTIDREELASRIDARVDEMIAAGAAEEARAAAEAGASRTARAALGFEELLAGELDAVKRAHRAYARRQLTWMRKMEGVELIDRTGRDDSDVAREIVASLD